MVAHLCVPKFLPRHAHLVGEHGGVDVHHLALAQQQALARGDLRGGFDLGAGVHPALAPGTVTEGTPPGAGLAVPRVEVGRGRDDAPVLPLLSPTHRATSSRADSQGLRPGEDRAHLPGIVNRALGTKGADVNW
jgi:hypothetical protein